MWHKHNKAFVKNSSIVLLLSFSRQMVCDVSCVDTVPAHAKIKSCIFKWDANESAWWTGLLAWNVITSVVPFANEFTFPLSLSLSFSLLLAFTLHVPCNPLCGSMSWIPNLWRDSSRKKKKSCHFKHPSHILYNKVSVVYREGESEDGLSLCLFFCFGF